MIIFVFGAGTVLKFVPAFQETFGSSKAGTQTNAAGNDQSAAQLSFDKRSIAQINALIDTNVKSRNNWIDLNGGFQRALCMTYVRDPGDIDVYKLNNGQLIYNLEKQDMKWYISRLTGLYHHIRKTGNSDFMYVQLPFKVENDSMMPAGAKEFGNENADELLTGAERAGIKTLDIRELMHKEKIDYDKAFISTDQHWKPETARWAADKICSYAGRTFGMPYDSTFFDPANWDTKTYKDWFLGSLGKRTGKLFGGVSDFDILTPKFNTAFDFKAKSANGRPHRHGDFEEALLAPKNIETKNLFNLNPYATYIGGDYKINTVTNELADNDCSVLLVRDSFSCAMQPFLCLNYGKVTAIDLRHYDDGTLKELIDNNKYDLIIAAYNPSAFSKEQFSFE